MIAKNDISVYRTQGDTDPFVTNLSVVNADGSVTKVPSSASVKLNLKLDTLQTINAISTSNGIFAFSLANVDTSNTHSCNFEIRVTSDYTYVIGSGVMTFNPRLV